MKNQFRALVVLTANFIFGIALGAAGQASLSNPVLSSFNDILFVERSIRADISGLEFQGDHMCDQYHAFNARKGGGLYILRNFKSASPQRVDVVNGLKVPGGTNQGMLLSDGAFLSPDLSYDGQTIVFAWTSGDTVPWIQKNRWTLFSVNVDGTNLKRLTDSNNDDFDPCWLPNGRIVFISTRRGGFGRCHPHAKPTFTMYSMKADGSDLFCISFHETNEWQPSVDNNGKIVYSRWDYIDRDSDVAHHIWECFPDGRDPRSWHGNYPYPLSTIKEATAVNLYVGDGRHKRPWMEQNIRAIPNAQGKYVATASIHHGQAFGSLILIDINKVDDNMISQLTRLTPDVPFPEAEVGTEQSWEKYGTPWPFSENYFLCNYLNGIYFYEASSKTKILIYQSTVDKFRPIDPIPVMARLAPPVLSTRTCQGELLKPNSPNATISVMNVTLGDMALPQGTKIKSMRIVQVFPKTTILVDNPKVHYGEQGLCRMSIGTVPVESDGSVYCKAPVGREIYFQLLDEKGLAVHSMRAGTYVHPGEQMSCTGCHENKWSAVPVMPQRIALQRPPSAITPEPPAVEPVSFYRTVKPIFDAKCVSCHTQQGKGPDMSYASLQPYAFYFDAGGNGSIMDSAIGGSRTIPGYFGARYSRMYQGGYLDSSHYKVSLTANEFRRITLWLDLNSYELGAYHNVADQKLGKLVWPQVDADSINPQGVENRIVTSNISVYHPETANAKITIIGKAIKLSVPFAGDCSVDLFTLNGRIVSHTLVKGIGTFSLPVTHCAMGMYMLSVTHLKGKSMEKVFLR
jgi:hypothetical protein